MALLLQQADLFSQNDHQRGIIEQFTVESPVLDRLDFLNVIGPAYAYDREATLPGVEFRAVNAGYAESTGTINQATEKIVIMGGDADVDNFLVATRGNLYNLRAVQEAMKVKALVFKFQDAFVNGDTAVDANSFDGLKKRLTGAQVIAAAPNGLPIMGADDNARQAFLDKMDELIAAVAGGPDAFYANSAVLSKFKSAARRLLIFDQTIDSYGKQVATYQGIPFIDIGKTAAGAEVIPQTEPVGSGTTITNNSSSIYAVKFGRDEQEEAVSGLSNGTISVKDLGELDAKPVHRTRIEFYCGLAVFNGKGAARLSGVLNS